MKRITIVGTGYVGISMLALLSQNNKVLAFDIDNERVDIINNNKSSINDKLIDSFIKKFSNNIKATSDPDEAFYDTDLIIIATPTDFDEEKKYFNTKSIEIVIDQAVKRNFVGPIVIKSTVPVGFTRRINALYDNKILFSPEFLREGNSLQDNLHPSRIIISSECDDAKMVANLLQDATVNKNAPILFMNYEEAESVKLFANSYLAMRVSYFNELDTYAMTNNLNSKNIIDGICLDKRIGDFYNNPSFGYGGYCLPKDTKQLYEDFNEIPQSLIKSIVKSNEIRKNFITEEILKLNPKVVGVYRLSMKEGSDNFRHSAIIDIMNDLKLNGIMIYIYEPMITTSNFNSIPVLPDLDEFKAKCSLIICNRNSDSLLDVKEKVFSRDIFNIN